MCTSHEKLIFFVAIVKRMVHYTCIYMVYLSSYFKDHMSLFWHRSDKIVWYGRNSTWTHPRKLSNLLVSYVLHLLFARCRAVVAVFIRMHRWNECRTDWICHLFHCDWLSETRGFPSPSIWPWHRCDEDLSMAVLSSTPGGKQMQINVKAFLNFLRPYWYPFTYTHLISYMPYFITQMIFILTKYHCTSFSTDIFPSLSITTKYDICNCHPRNVYRFNQDQQDKTLETY